VTSATVAAPSTTVTRSGNRGWRSAILGAGAVAVVLPLTAFVVAAWLLGWQLQSVQTGSMAPIYPVGSLLVVAQIDAGDVSIGMAITFEDPGEPDRLVTHRVIGFAPSGGLQFLTQGDANASPDALPVPARLVHGRVLWSVRDLGTLMDWIQWPRSFLVLVVVPGALLLFGAWRDRRRKI
jgi:signal peptidase